MKELVKSIDAFWAAFGPWSPALLVVGFLCWWVTLITSYRQRIGRDPASAPGRHLGGGQAPPPLPPLPPKPPPRAAARPSAPNPVRPGKR